MYVAIARGVGVFFSEGIFDCIVESTRVGFENREEGCRKEIYASFDEQGQNFITLDCVGISCFNLFYGHCRRAMECFPTSERAKDLSEHRIPIILSHWSEMLRVMREDPRYRD